MPNSLEDKKKIITRIKRIKGQIQALESNLDNVTESDCRTTLQQIAAIRGATNGLMAEILEIHIKESFNLENNPDPKIDEPIKDVINIIRTYLK
ncbi:metal/formaldehyde-sensitive transcriptional repressor [Otariodibacter sp.]|uniref:metal/formaldehyde-sensitive transcriptional repressor n=1 Tax=Otariodibacter sp. TaxID=3030919 RepID=UPI00262AF7DE|nr:metal/formaldehyde-sensitive transcriptional repressor [Otariodibacter sp.]